MSYGGFDLQGYFQGQLLFFKYELPILTSYSEKPWIKVSFKGHLIDGIARYQGNYYKSCWGHQGPPFVDLEFNLEGNCQGYSKVNLRFSK